MADQGQAQRMAMHAYVGMGLFFVMVAGVLSDFAVPWDDAEIRYELATIAGLLVSALLMRRDGRMPRRLVLCGAALAFTASLYIQVRGIAPWPFILLRLGLAPMIVYAFWIANAALDRDAARFPFALAISLPYAVLSALVHSRVLASHYGAVSALFCPLGALFLLRTESLAARQASLMPVPTSLHARHGGKPPTQPMRLLLILLLLMGQLFNSLDVILFNQIAGVEAALSGDAAYPVLLLLIGAGYLWGSLVAHRDGLSTLFIVSCVLTQVFLLIDLLPLPDAWPRRTLPLYVLGTAGIDLSMILSPRILWRSDLLPVQTIAGFVLFRLSKLYIIPSLLPARWKALPLGSLIVVLMVLLALGQMLVMFLFLLRRHSVAPADAPPPPTPEAPPPPPLPDTMTPREREVALLLLDGNDRNTIAEIMGISFSTVNKHCVSVYRKTGCASHVELLITYGRTGNASENPP